jgi:uncharacterized protein YceK
MAIFICMALFGPRRDRSRRDRSCRLNEHQRALSQTGLAVGSELDMNSQAPPICPLNWPAKGWSVSFKRWPWVLEVLRSILISLALSFMSGCGTVTTIVRPTAACTGPGAAQLQLDKPRYIYSGIRCDAGWFKQDWPVSLLFVPDFPLSFAADTLLLPVRIAQAIWTRSTDPVITNTRR